MRAYILNYEFILMNVIITGTGFGFPDGTGSTSRVMAFAKCILNNDGFVNVFCLKPTENHGTDGRNIKLKGVYDGIPFEYTCGKRIIANTRIGAFYLYLKGLFRSYIAIISINKKKPVDAIILWYGEEILNFIFFFILTRLIGAVLILEKSEYPFVYSKRTITKKIMIIFYEKISLKYVDGVIVITEYLKKYYEKHLGKNGRILKMPIIVDVGLFYSKKPKNRFVKKKIIYCGNLDHNSEIIDLLMAFKIISKDYPDWILEIIGPITDVRMMKIYNTLLFTNDLQKRVLFVGQVSRSEIPERLSTADIMVLPRTLGKFSTAGFPTKLGEYLATGIPVIVTKTGEIGEYLKDKESAYLVMPNEKKEFSRVLREVISNYSDAIKVGKNGRAVAIREFDLKVQSKRLLNYISEFYK